MTTGDPPNPTSPDPPPPGMPPRMAGYTVQLPAYHGPLDLLLHLVRRDEIDIRAVELGRLATQFLDFLAAAALLDVDLAGEFVVVAATLLEIKVRSLLPAPPKEEAAPDAPPDPRRDLVRQLLEYRQFKEAAQALEARAETHALQFARVAPPAEGTNDGPPVRPVEVWDLVSAFARLLRETEPTDATAVVADETPQYVHEARISAEVAKLGRVSLRDLFTAPRTRARLIGLFLAVLELVKRGAVRAELDATDGELWLSAGVATAGAGG